MSDFNPVQIAQEKRQMPLSEDSVLPSAPISCPISHSRPSELIRTCVFKTGSEKAPSDQRYQADQGSGIYTVIHRKEVLWGLELTLSCPTKNGDTAPAILGKLLELPRVPQLGGLASRLGCNSSAK